MRILPNERRTHDESGMLLPAVHRADAYREITEARRKLDEQRERELQAGDTDRAETACRTCIIPLPDAYDFNCTDCLARLIFKTRSRPQWTDAVQLADKGRSRSIAFELIMKLYALQLAEIEKAKSSHKGEFA